RHERETAMAGITIPHFQNDAGHPAIEIGVKEFKCVGANPPFDHPHIFIDTRDEDEAVCSYCSTLYRYQPKLKASAAKPPVGTYTEDAAGHRPSGRGGVPGRWLPPGPGLLGWQRHWHSRSAPLTSVPAGRQPVSGRSAPACNSPPALRARSAGWASF